MYNEQIESLPENVRSNAVSLAPLGLSSFGWSLEYIFSVIDSLNGWVILGGDLYEVDGERIIPMTESWYFEPSSAADSSLSSIKEAKRYLTGVRRWAKHKTILVDIVAVKER